MPWNEKGRAGVMDAMEKKLSKLLNSLCEVRSMTSAWSALHPETKAWTRQTSLITGSGSSHIDHILVSTCLVQSKVITRIGILQDEAVGNSDHRLVIMEFDIKRALNLTDAHLVYKRPKKMDIQNKIQVKKFCDKVMATLPQGQMLEELVGLEKLSMLSPIPNNLSPKIIRWFDHLA